MSEKEIRDHYAQKNFKPVFFTIRNDSAELYCATTGADTLPPLLLIHGAPGAWYSGIGILDDPEIQKHFHIIAVDRPGYHYSKLRGKKKPVTSIESQATIIHEALRVNRSRKPGVIYGTSYGAPIAVKMVAKYPGTFSHLLMVGGAFDPENEKFWWFHKYANGLLVRLFLPRFMNTATDEKFTHVSELTRLLPDWQKIDIPVTVIQGSDDNIVPTANFDFARRMLQGKNASFIMIPGAGHLVRRSHPEVIRSELLKLVRK